MNKDGYLILERVLCSRTGYPKREWTGKWPFHSRGNHPIPVPHQREWPQIRAPTLTSAVRPCPRPLGY